MASAFLAHVMAGFGTATVAGNAVVDRVVPVAFGGLFALSGAIGPILAQNWGAGRFDRMRGVLGAAIRVTLAYCAGVWLLLALGREWLARRPLPDLWASAEFDPRRRRWEAARETEAGEQAQYAAPVGSVGGKRLVVLEPRDRRGTTFGIAAELTMGRSHECTVQVLDDTFISSLHCRIFRDEAGNAILEDLGSTNGTYLNGKRIGSYTPVPLTDADMASFEAWFKRGRHVNKLWRFYIEGAQTKGVVAKDWEI